jgi:stage III sporulation protein AD
MLLSAAVTQIAPVVQALQDFSREAGLQSDTIALLLRLISMAYLTEFSVQACRDAGEDGLAQKAALAGKILLAAQTVPLITAIGALAMDMLP